MILSRACWLFPQRPDPIHHYFFKNLRGRIVPFLNALVSDLNLGRIDPLVPAPRSPAPVMDVRASLRTSEDGTGPSQTVRRPQSANRDRHSWSGYNNGPLSSIASPRPHGRVSFLWVTAEENQSSWSEDERSYSAPSSRSSSPGARPSSRSGVPNFSRVLPSRTSILSTIMENRSASDSAESLRNRLRSCQVRRWEPDWKTTTPWDGLRRVRPIDPSSFEHVVTFKLLGSRALVQNWRLSRASVCERTL